MKGVVKSVRVDENVLSTIENTLIDYSDGPKFNQVVNTALRAFTNQWNWLPNLKIHDYAKLAPVELYERTEGLKFLRSRARCETFTFYPTSQDELETNRKVYDYVNGAQNALNDTYIYFNLQMPSSLYHFLLTRSYDEVERVIASYLCTLFYLQSDEDEKEIIEGQVHKKYVIQLPLLKEKYGFDKLIKQKKLGFRSNDPLALVEYTSALLKKLAEMGITSDIYPLMMPILEFIHYPFSYRDQIMSLGRHDIPLRGAYLRNVYEKDDWSEVVLEGKKDDLQRAESWVEPIKNWREQYSYYHRL